MNNGDWRYAYVSVDGSRHLRDGVPCQDASDCTVVDTRTGEKVLVAVVADGAGSAPRGGEGAASACELFMELASNALACGDNLHGLGEEGARVLVERVRASLGVIAETDSAPFADYACTLLAAMIGESGALFLQLGDGVVVVQEAGDQEEYSWVFWPNRGEYENETVFLTSDAAMDQLAISFVCHRIDEVSLITDGLQNLALRLKDRVVHSQFFAPIFTEARRSDATGPLSDLSGQLRQFLSSDRILEKTDDDKSIVVATRKPRVRPGSSCDCGES